MEIRIEDSECSLSDSEQLVNNEVAEDSANISVTTSDENLESPESTTTVTIVENENTLQIFLKM